MNTTTSLLPSTLDRLNNQPTLNPSVIITSESFKGKQQLARHRMVNTLMKDELAREGGIHALQLTTRTPDEEEQRKQKEAAT
jgi:acid stress-induced BolA-like protein IbaG/YrbA